MPRGRLQISTKRVMINKANSTIVVAVGVAAFVSAFALVTSRSLLARRSYQAKVIGLQEKARDQLRQNLAAVDTLKGSYAAFASQQENIINGDSKGDGERDGDNARVVLDALPSKYDFPALAASLEKILLDRGYTILTITGPDDEVTQNGQPGSAGQGATAPVAPPGGTTPLAGAATTGQPATPGSAVDMPFEIGAKGNYKSLTNLLKVMQDSIRPMSVQHLNFAADEDGGVSLTVTGKSYYQPAKSLNITEEVVK